MLILSATFGSRRLFLSQVSLNVLLSASNTGRNLFHPEVRTQLREQI